jgi:hypothetical protein
VAVAVGLVLGAGMTFTLREGLVVAPKAARAGDSRLIMHNKSVPRLARER